MDPLSKSPQQFSKVVGVEKLMLEDGDADPASRVIDVIVKTKTANYVPECLEERSRIDEYMFTAHTTAAHLEALDADEDIESVSISKSLRVIK